MCVCVYIHTLYTIYYILCEISWVLGAFATLRKATKGLVMSVVCPPARMEQLGSHWMECHEICCLSTFRRYVEKIQVSLKPHKNNGYFT